MILGTFAYKSGIFRVQFREKRGVTEWLVEKENQRFSDICSADTVCLYFHTAQQPWLELDAFKGDTRALSDTGLFPARPELTAFRAVLQSISCFQP